MYKILIKKAQMPKNTYSLYTETITEVNEETEAVTKTTSIYETDSLDTLAEKYKELLNTYTTGQILVVDELDVNLIANITDTTE